MKFCTGENNQTPFSNFNRGIIATIRVEPSVLAFLAIISKSVNNQCYNTFLESSFRDLSENVWVVELIVNRFLDNRKKHQHRRLNSYRGDRHKDWRFIKIFIKII